MRKAEELCRNNIQWAQDHFKYQSNKLAEWQAELERHWAAGHRGELIDHDLYCIEEAVKGMLWARGYEQVYMENLKDAQKAKAE